MTDLQMLYLKARTEMKCGHRKAIDLVSSKTGIDSGTVARSLARAKRADERDERQSKREVKA